MPEDRQANGLKLLACSEAEADLYAFRRGREAATTVRIIRGQRCTVLDRCMSECAAALQFPYCFEGTWASFRQSLQDLTWRDADRVVILITSANRVLPRAAADFAEMLQELQHYALNEKPEVNIVLQTERRFVDALVERSARANVKLGALDL